MSSRLLLFPYLQFNYSLCFPDSVNSILNLQEQNELQSVGFCLKASFPFSPSLHQWLKTTSHCCCINTYAALPTSTLCSHTNACLVRDMMQRAGLAYAELK